MPRLNQRKGDDTIATYLRLPRTTRDELESCIGHDNIQSLTDAVVEASKLLAKQVNRQRPPKTSKDSKVL